MLDFMDDRECFWNTQSERYRKWAAVNSAGTEFSWTRGRGSKTENKNNSYLERCWAS